MKRPPSFAVLRRALPLLLAGFAPAVLFAATNPLPTPPAQPSVPERAFTLSDFNAPSDGRTPSTEAFRRAIAAMQAAGGGTLSIPAGDYLLTGRVNLCSRIHLVLEAGSRLVFSDRFDDYPPENGRRLPLIRARDCEDIIISGEGVIDGQGQAWWDQVRRELADAAAQHIRWEAAKKQPRPCLLGFEQSRRIRIEGIEVRNSPHFQCVLVRCQDVTITGVKVSAPEASYNTDGIDPINCQRVRISDCHIDTGDDCIALKASPGSPGTSDVLISDCVFREGHGCSLGSNVGPYIRNVLVQRCTFEGTDIGVRFKSSRTRGGVVENITFTDLEMKDVKTVIGLSDYYPGYTTPKFGENVAPAPVTSHTPVVRQFVIRNLVATDCASAGAILGLPEKPIEGLVLDNVTIEADRGMRLAYTKGLTLRNVDVRTKTGKPFLIEDSVTDLHREGGNHARAEASL